MESVIEKELVVSPLDPTILTITDTTTSRLCWTEIGLTDDVERFRYPEVVLTLMHGRNHVGHFHKPSRGCQSEDDVLELDVHMMTWTIFMFVTMKTTGHLGQDLSTNLTFLIEIDP